MIIKRTAFAVPTLDLGVLSLAAGFWAGLASETRLRGKRGGSFGVQEAATPPGHARRSEGNAATIGLTPAKDKTIPVCDRKLVFALRSCPARGLPFLLKEIVPVGNPTGLKNDFGAFCCAPRCGIDAKGWDREERPWAVEHNEARGRRKAARRGNGGRRAGRDHRPAARLCAAFI